MTITDGINVFNEIKKIVIKYNNKDLIEKILNLQEYLMNLSEKNIELKTQVTKLQSQLETPKDIDIDDNGFIVKKGDNRKYCPRCWNKERKLSLMPRKGVDSLGTNLYGHMCSACEMIVNTEEEKY